MIARLLIGSLETRSQKIKELVEESELKNPHPDLLYFSSDSKLGIEQARKIKEFFSLKPYSAKGRGVVLEDASQLTDEAQNALLKILEEPPSNALLILGASSDGKLLPTILSRCEIVRLSVDLVGHTHPTYEVNSQEIEKLLTSTIEQRFEYIEKLKDREEFLHSLITCFHQNLPANSQFVKELLQTEEWQNQNVNIRAILEYLMLCMPQKL